MFSKRFVRRRYCTTIALTCMDAPPISVWIRHLVGIPPMKAYTVAPQPLSPPYVFSVAQFCIVVIWQLKPLELEELLCTRSAVITGVDCVIRSCKGAITSKIKHAVKHKTSPAQLLHNCCSPHWHFVLACSQ